MASRIPTLERRAAGGIALLALGALIVQLAVNTGRDGSLPGAALGLMRFFTIWSNLAVAVLLGSMVLGRRVGEAALLALASSIAIVAIVYHLLLAAQFHPTGVDWWTDQVFHSLVPALTLVWWLSFSQPVRSRFRGLAWVVVPPIAYTIVTLAAAQRTGFYPYFFLDVHTLGWPSVLLNMLGLGAGFVLVAAGLLLSRAIVRRLA